MVSARTFSQDLDST